jgi:hypothetical protein
MKAANAAATDALPDQNNLNPSSASTCKIKCVPEADCPAQIEIALRNITVSAVQPNGTTGCGGAVKERRVSD